MSKQPESLRNQELLPFIHNFLLTGLNPEYMATDSKDRVFGLIGILRTLGIELAVPDYRKALPELLLETFTSIATEQKSLDLLTFVTGEHSIDSLPTWIPDFCAVPWCSSTTVSGLPDWFDPKCQALGCSDFTIKGRKLTLKGIEDRKSVV